MMREQIIREEKATLHSFHTDKEELQDFITRKILSSKQYNDNPEL